MKRNWLKMVGLGAVVFMLAACNTVEGFGQDVETAGKTIEDTAN